MVLFPKLDRSFDTNIPALLNNLSEAIDVIYKGNIILATNERIGYFKGPFYFQNYRGSEVIGKHYSLS